MPRQAPPPLPLQPATLDPAVWRACAGGSVEIPMPNSKVYYFPQGHFDQASSVPRNPSPHLLARPIIPCNVASVEYLADPHTDEVFVKMNLQPVVGNFAPEPFPIAAAAPPNDDNEVVAFTKILTPSDANNGGGFSMPRYCADSIFPPLDFQSDPPVQTLFVTDVHGFTWEFRHIYRGTPRRHLLTTGWSTFVNNKKLVAGDSVVFMRKAGHLLVGLRRATRFASGKGGSSGPKLRLIDEEEEVEEEEEDEEKSVGVFSRDGKGKLSAKAVVEAAELAARNMPFEVVYYPKAGWPEFVLNTETVNAAMRIAWSAGVRVKMSMETDDASKTTWFQGTVTAVSSRDNGQWSSSPWRMLQVTWDEPEVLQDATWVSPWQVELDSATSVLHSEFPQTKRHKTAHGSGVFTDGERERYSVNRVTNSEMGHENQPFWPYPPIPAGMQGARHDAFSASSFSSYERDFFSNSSVGHNSFARPATELNVGSSPIKELSPDSHHSCVTDPIENHHMFNFMEPESSASDSDSFLLFGQSIKKEPPVQNRTACSK